MGTRSGQVLFYTQMDIIIITSSSRILLSLVSWITVTHFLGVSLSSIFKNYSASKIVQLESYQIPVDMLV